MKSYRKILGITTLLCMMSASTALAAEGDIPSKDALQKQFEQVFSQMLANPADVDVALHYSYLAEQLGDYEAAIPPMERLLMFNPDLPHIKLKLGVFYHKLGSDDVARTYFEDVVDGKNATRPIIAEARKYLKQL